MTVSGSKKKYCSPDIIKILIPVLKKSGCNKNLPVQWKRDNKVPPNRQGSPNDLKKRVKRIKKDFYIFEGF